ncbi:sulfate transporter [Acidovorax sp. SRB_14]|uniref:universal stress protein n=1 Tax=unclassified Acidovorax TaxID=2684926 RepID=UPI00145D49F0|nr:MULTISPECIES: universal stress protein [unclassified Acidovorax]NMM75906.1 sulfate transporter [Acidovorax sp. SRB_24]NMM81542.1 sulfate transporter [Acidovorax sp. SRB_14]NMM89947.1 sulfate transporter [Rhodococcus sp. SRB_17]
MFKHILVPTDGSALSLSSVARAASYAKDSGARITLFYAQPDPPSAYAGLGALSNPHLAQEIQTRLDEAAKEILAAAQALVRDAGTPCQSVVLVGDKPYELIIAAADAHGCDLIFMASHGRSGVSALLLGSETQKVLAHSKIPVLVYR